MQDLIGTNFAAFGTVKTFSWLSTDVRDHGLGNEMRQAVLHLAIAGLGARQADSRGVGQGCGQRRCKRPTLKAPITRPT